MKNTKKALLTSSLCLLLCFSMLVGTTFAWFTDEVSTLNNKIVAGNLDVELYNALAGNLSDDTKVEDGGLFEDIKYWEPGVVAYENLTIANEGTLALKYALSVNFEDVNTFNGKGLSQILKVAFVPGGIEETASRAQVIAAAETAGLAGMASFAQNGKLLPKEHAHITEIDKTGIPVETVTYAIVIYWEPSDNDNDWNVNNGQNTSNSDPLQINLGVNLFATQLVAEDDSFGPDYDENAQYVIGAGESSTYVGADIDGTVENYGDVTISGGSITQNGNNAIYNEGNAELKDVELNMTGSSGYIANSRGDGSVTIFENVDATSTGGGVNVWEGEAIFKSGTVTTNSTSTSPRHVFYVAAGGKLTIKEGTFTFSPTNLTRKGSYLCAQGANAVIIVEGGTFGKPSTRTAPVQEIDGGDVIIRGGTFAWDPSNWVDSGYKVTKDGANWVVSPKATDNASLNEAIANGETNIALGDGNYTLPSASNSEVTINGTKDTVITVNKPAYHGSNVTFNGVTIKGSGYSTGVQHVNTVTYNDATIVGEMCLYGEKVVFNNCTFELNGQYIWTYGAKEVEFNNCTFNTTGKAILIYNEGAGASKVTVKGCTFNATAGAKAGAIANQNCAAIEIDNHQNSGIGTAHVLITEGNTYSENFSGEWRIKNFVSGNAVTVNGVSYSQIAIDGKLMTIDASKNVTVQ